MNIIARNIFATSLVLGLTASDLLAQTPTSLGNLPLWFEAGASQTDGVTKYVARGADSEFTIAPAQATFVLHKADGQTAACTLQFVGGNAASRISADAELTGKINYLLGDNPARWQTGVATFARVQAEAVYPGVDVTYYGNHQRLEYDFNLAAGVNPAVIAIRFDGAEKISVNAQGELVVGLHGGEIVQPRPVAYQTVHGQRQEIAAGFKVLDARTVAFAMGNYDQGQPLVIDPVLSYSTYFGGNYGENAWAVALNPTDGSIYVAGQTLSTQHTNSLPFATTGAFQSGYRGSSQQFAGDAFVARFDATGTNLIYATYLGGSADDAAYALAVDAAGHAFVAGTTDSTNFPVKNAIPGGSTIGGKFDANVGSFPFDAFVTELQADGSALVYSTYLGGRSSDAAFGIALDPSGDAFVTGLTHSTNFPVTANAFQKHLACTNNFYGNNYNSFVTEIAAGGNQLNYSSYLGGTNFDVGRAIAFNAGYLVVAGFTASTNFPSVNALPGYTRLNGALNDTYGYDAFVAEFVASGPAVTILYSTFLGGTNSDVAFGAAVDASGNAYVVGSTSSTNFPYTAGVLSGFGTNSPSVVHTNATGYVVATNAFLTQIKWTGANSALGYSVMFGGRGNDFATAVALAPDGNVFVTGNASSTNFPIVNVTNGSAFLRPTNSGLSDVFVVAFANNASQMLYSTYLGGSDNDFAYGIAADSLDAVYVAGQTYSTNFPTLNARQKNREGTNDMFLTKIALIVGVAPAITGQPASLFKAVGSNAIFSVTAGGTAPLTYQWFYSVTGVNGWHSLPAATNSALPLSNVQLTNAGFYCVIVSNPYGKQTSTFARLAVGLAPVITLQPVGLTNNDGGNATFTVAADGTAPLTYQWFYSVTGTNSWHSIPAATNSTFTLNNLKANNTGYYCVIVNNPYGSQTSALVPLLVVGIAPSISSQPASLTTAVGSIATFTVTADGTAPLTYQWFYSVTGINGWHPILPATNFTLTISNPQATNAGFYCVIVNNAYGSQTSDFAQLTIGQPPQPAITLHSAALTAPPNKKTGAQFQFTFTPVANHTNTVLTNGALFGGVWGVFTNFPPTASPTPIVITDVPGPGSLFYRVQVAP